MPKPQKIFIVDDADFMVDMLRVIVRDAGYRVVGTALNGEQAISAVKALPAADLPGIVTVDFHMPRMDGMEFVGHIRALIPGVKIVMISSNATLPVVQQAKNAGIDAFIVKPFEPKVVLDTLAKLK